MPSTGSAAEQPLRASIGSLDSKGTPKTASKQDRAAVPTWFCVSSCCWIHFIFFCFVPFLLLYTGPRMRALDLQQNGKQESCVMPVRDADAAYVVNGWAREDEVFPVGGEVMKAVYILACGGDTVQRNEQACKFPERRQFTCLVVRESRLVTFLDKKMVDLTISENFSILGGLIQNLVFFVLTAFSTVMFVWVVRVANGEDAQTSAWPVDDGSGELFKGEPGDSAGDDGGGDDGGVGDNLWAVGNAVLA